MVSVNIQLKKMVNKKMVALYLSVDEKTIILNGANTEGLPLSAFCRTAALHKARKILKENTEGSLDTG